MVVFRYMIVNTLHKCDKRIIKIITITIIIVRRRRRSQRG